MKNAGAKTERTDPIRAGLILAITVMIAFTIYEASQLGWIRSSLFGAGIAKSVEPFP
jgi:hypothetical protein